MSLRSLTVFVVSMAFGLTVFARAAEAQKGPEKVFGGKIMVSDKKYPSFAKSVGAYIGAIKKQSKTKFWEDKTKQSWKIYFAAFFKKGLTDIEVVVKLYDVSTRTKSLLASFEQYTEQRGQTALLSNFTLNRDQVGVNKSVLMQLEVSGRVVASGYFKILGEAEVYSGKVDFSEEDTQKRDDDE